MPIELLTMLDRRLAVLLLPDPERRVLRFLFRYGDSVRTMAWMQIGADGRTHSQRRGQDGARFAESRPTWFCCECSLLDQDGPRPPANATGLGVA